MHGTEHDKVAEAPAMRGIAKAPTGIAGLDELTGGGLPAGRPTLLCGAAGCGKTVLALTFLYNGATKFGEPGVLVTFEERLEDLVQNVTSLNYNLNQLLADNKLAVDHVRIERTEIEETGEYDLEGLFIRLGHQIDSIGAKRVVLDTIEALYGGLTNQVILRAELRRLFEWLKDKGVTTIVTGERGEKQLTRFGLEEYVSDCVILLDSRVQDQVATRRLRVVKYRGSSHGMNEYPFLIDDQGVSVMPITSAGLAHEVSSERISSGIPDLDDMLGGQGFYRGSSILVSGMAGSGKTSVIAHFANSICKQGGRCVYFAFEESPSQIVRNMRSIGLDLKQWIDKGLLQFHANRPTVFGLETHLASMHREIEHFRPDAVVIDPISSLLGAGIAGDVGAMSLRLVDLFKAKTITAMFSSLTYGNVETATTDVDISSLIDTWLLLYNRENNGEHNRQLYLLKSRGMAHSNQVREFILTGDGISLRDVYVGPEGLLTGSARIAQEAREQARKLEHRQEIERRTREFERRRRQIEAEVEELQARLASEKAEIDYLASEELDRDNQIAADRLAMARSRRVDGGGEHERTGTFRDTDAFRFGKRRP